MFGFSLRTIAIAALTIISGCLAMVAARRWTIATRRVWPYVWVLTFVLAALYAALAIWRHQQFETHAFDLGIFDQALWHLGRFEAPASTVRGVANLFGDHFHPILVTLVPFTWIFRTPLVLLVAQAILLAGTLPLAFLLGSRLRIPPLPALVFGLAIAAHPGMVLAVNFDFHEVAFAPALMIGTTLAATLGRWRWYWVGLGLLIMTKESVSVYAALLGLTVALRNIGSGWRSVAVRQGLGGFVAGLVAFFVVTKLVIPALAPDQGYVYWKQYERVGATPTQLAVNLVAHPVRTLQVLRDTPEKRLTAKYMLASAAYLPLLSPATWPLTLLTFGERFWTEYRGIWLFQFHYQLLMLTVFGLGVLFVAHDAERWKRLRGLSAALAIMVVVGSVWTYSKLRPWDILSTVPIVGRPTAAWHDALDRIPVSAAVSAQDAFVPHLTRRAAIYHYPNVADAEWILLDPRAPSWPLMADEVRQAQDGLRRDGGWIPVIDDTALTLFRRR